MKDNYMFPAIFDYAEDGISIEFPDLPGCLSSASNDEEALYNAKDVLRGFLLFMEEDGELIPAPSKLKDIKTESNQKSVLVEISLAIARRAKLNKAVKKTLTIPFWLNEKAEKENINFSHTLQEALIEKLALAK